MPLSYIYIYINVYTRKLTHTQTHKHTNTHTCIISLLLRTNELLPSAGLLLLLLFNKRNDVGCVSCFVRRDSFGFAALLLCVSLFTCYLHANGDLEPYNYLPVSIGQLLSLTWSLCKDLSIARDRSLEQ